MSHNSSDLVSIGIPFFNPGPDIKLSVKSVFAQSHSNFELLLVNDGSSDESLQLVNRIKDPRVKVISHTKNLGLVYSLNEIIKHSKGKYVARMDADDIMHPDRIRRQVNFLEKNPDFDVIDSKAIIIDGRNNPKGLLKRTSFDTSRSASDFLKWGAVLHPSVMTRKTWSSKYPYNPDFIRAEDRELFVRTLSDTKIKHLQEPLLFYRKGNKINLKSILDSYSSERKVLRLYGPRLVGYFETGILLLRSYCKTGVVKCFQARKGHLDIFKKHIIELTQMEKIEAERILEKVANTRVPGWNL